MTSHTDEQVKPNDEYPIDRPNAGGNSGGLSAAFFAGLVYFAIIFICGFILGTLRTLAVAPAFGEILAVALELPFILAAAWIVCRWTIDRFALADRPAPRLLMGGTAFFCLMAAELALSVFLAGRSPADHFLLYRETASQLGLAGQVLFALFPIWARRRPPSPSTLA